MNGRNFTIFQPPVSIPMLTSNGTPSPEWRQFFSGMNLYFQNFQNVIPVPSLSTTQINSLSGVDNGWIVYNNTSNSFQGYVDGAWKTFTLT